MARGGRILSSAAVQGLYEHPRPINFVALRQEFDPSKQELRLGVGGDRRIMTRAQRRDLRVDNDRIPPLQ